MSDIEKVYKSDLDYIHDIAEELSIDLQRKGHFDNSEKAQKIVDKIESDDFVVDDFVVEDRRRGE